MEARASSKHRWSRARFAGLLAALLVALGLGTWRLRQSTNTRIDAAAAPRVRGAEPFAPGAQQLAVLERASDGLPIKPAEADGPVPEGPMHPHPITPAHERIYRENNLIGALNLAVDLADPSRIRDVLARYRMEYPEDAHRLQDGYALIAECLEHLDDTTRERAQRFWNTEIRSQTRRYVRRYCLAS